MTDKSASCVCKCQNKCECAPDETAAGCEREEEMKVLETRRVSISVDVTSIENQAPKNESQETQYEEPSNVCPPQTAEGAEKGANIKRPCNSPNPTKPCMGNQRSVEKEINKPPELKSPKSSSVKLSSKRSNSIHSLSGVNSDYAGDEWDRFGLFVAAECKSMTKENSKNFKIKCLELILEYQ